MKRTWIIALVVFFPGAGSAQADQVTMKNGDRLTGIIVKTDEKAQTLLIKTDLEGDVNVKWDGIASLVSAQPLHLTLKSGETIVGRVSSEGSRLVVSTRGGGEATAEKGAVATLRNDAEEAAFEQKMERLQHPRFTDVWNGLLDTGLNLTRGNSSTATYNLAGKLSRVTKRNKLGMYATAIYSRDDTTSPSRATAHAVRGGARFDLNATDRLFGFVLSDFEYDRFQNLDLRNTTGTGFGYYLWKKEHSQFDFFGGGTFLQEYFSVPLDPLVPGSTSRKSGEGVVGEELSTALHKWATVSERYAFYPNFTSTGEYRFTLDATAAIKLNSWLGWQTTVSDHYISDPAPGKKPNDLLLSAGLRLTFGKGVF